MHTLFVAVAVVVNTVLVAWTVRRLMGGPVGWPRIFVFSFIVALIANPLLLATLEHAGIDDPAAAEHAGLTAALSVLFIGWVIAFEISILVAADRKPAGDHDAPAGIPGPDADTRRIARAARLPPIGRRAARSGGGCAHRQ